MFASNWQRDHAKETPVEPSQEDIEATSARASWTARLHHWKGIAGQWVRAHAGGWISRPMISREEEILQGMREALEKAVGPEAVERILIESVRSMTGARSIRWSVEEEDLEPMDGGVGVVIASDGAPRRRLFISVPSGELPSWPAPTLHRLRMLCTMASHALSKTGAVGSCKVDQGASPCACLPVAEAGCRAEVECRENGLLKSYHVPPLLQDATFLNAILPFAFGQARRHGEPLSVLCAEVDRLGGIRDLLGREQADRAVRNVGSQIASMIRDSDIVARIEDDRIIALLPRSRIQDGWRLAQDVCRSVEKQLDLCPDLPGLTVSIGVAEYPACAGTIFALLDAADHALSEARSQGRNRAVAAKSLSTDDYSVRSWLVG